MSKRSEIIGDAPCPSCVKAGGDRTGNHLILFSDGGAYCNRCGYREGEKTFTKPARNLRGQKTDEQIAEELKWVRENSVVRSIKDRGLAQFACNYYDVRTGLSTSDGTTPVCFYYPVPNERGETTGYKVKTPDKRFWAKGKISDARFIGSDKIPQKGNKLFITEGEEDMLALYQAMYEHVEKKWRPKIAVVSLPNGAGGAAADMAKNAELLRSYREIVLCFDNDEPGQKAVEAALTVLPRDKVRVARFPLKDANDMLKAGQGREMYFCAIQADKPRPEKILSGSDISLDSLMTPLKPGIMTPFPGLNEKFRGFRFGQNGGELTTICAGTGMGKTTLARELMYCFNKEHKLRLGHIFLEEQNTKTAQSYVAIDNNVPLPQLRVNPSVIPREQFSKSYEELVNNHRCFFMKHWGSIDSSELIDHMFYFSKVEGCNFILLDHISLVVSGGTSKEGERKDLDILMTKLAAFTEESGTSVLAVVHLKRPENGSFNEGRSISLTHLRGSAAIEQLSHNIIAVEGHQHGNQPNVRVFRALKNREWGDIGVADTGMYYPDTGRLLPMNPLQSIKGG